MLLHRIQPLLSAQKSHFKYSYLRKYTRWQSGSSPVTRNFTFDITGNFFSLECLSKITCKYRCGQECCGEQRLLETSFTGNIVLGCLERFAYSAFPTRNSYVIRYYGNMLQQPATRHSVTTSLAYLMTKFSYVTTQAIGCCICSFHPYQQLLLSTGHKYILGWQQVISFRSIL